MSNFEALFSRWTPFARRLAGRHARRLRADAGDVFQEIALAAARHFPHYDPAASSFPTWLCWVARSVADHHAARSARRAACGGGAEDVAVGREPDPADAAAGRELRGRLAAAIGALPADQRAAVEADFELAGRPPWAAPPDPALVRAGLDRLRELLGG
jgi:RNA polymerase sigma factor (sigma-70 family)